MESKKQTEAKTVSKTGKTEKQQKVQNASFQTRSLLSQNCKMTGNLAKCNNASGGWPK